MDLPTKSPLVFKSAGSVFRPVKRYKSAHIWKISVTEALCCILSTFKHQLTHFYQIICKMKKTTQEFKVIFSGMLLLAFFPPSPMLTSFLVNFLSLTQSVLFFFSPTSNSNRIFFSFLLLFLSCYKLPHSSIFIGKSKHASKLEIHFLQTKYMKKIHPHPANINSNKSKTIIQ